MKEKKVEMKTALLLSPVKITENKQLLRFIQIHRNEKGVQYDIADLDESKIRKYYEGFPQQVRNALQQLNTEGLNKLEDEIIKRFKLQKSGMPLRQFLFPAYTRQLQERFEMIKPFAPLVKWYHQVPNAATGNVMTAPCVFSNYKPVLKFEVVKENEQLKLLSVISINGSDYYHEAFRRFHFLLLSNNEYFLLAFKDYKILEWLLQNDPQQYSQDANLFAQKILSVLETDYDVNRNNLFAVTTVDAVPVKRILLSEISNSFLVLTPQWLYDGYVAEGVWKESFEVSNNGEAVVVKRNKEEETTFKKLLEALHPNFVKQLNGYYYLSFADAQKKQWFLKVYHKLLEMDIEVIGMDMLTHFRYSSHKPVTEIQVINKTAETLTFDFSLQFGEEKIPLTELQKILIAGQRAVMLKDGSLGILPEEWLSTYSTIIRHSRVDKQRLTVPQWMAISQQQEVNEETAIQTTVSEAWWGNWQRWQNTGDILYPVPANIKATLRPYQQKGFEWMKLLAEVNAGACLADDMGLGKTLQTICFIADKLLQVKNALALIVCPSSLVYNWQQEISKFAPHLRTYIHHGSSRDHENILPATTDVCITSYGTLRSDIDFLAAIYFDIAVIDESHNIKNPSAQITRAVNQLHAGSKIALSGTPVMNNTFDLYSQLEFLLPGMFGNREFFKREYADPIDRDANEEKTAVLQKLTAPFILRRTKEQVAKDLPEKTETVLWCNMGAAQKNMYDDIRDSIRSNLFLDIKKDGLGKSKLAVLQGIMKLKQVCSSPLLLPAEEQTAALSVKTEILLDELTNLRQHKVLVFSQFSKMLHLLADTFTKKGISFYLLEGSTPAKKRAAMVEEFQQEENNTHVFLISLMAGNTGLTLTAADYVFLFDPWWNNAVQQQAIDRTHRIGQTKNVFAYKMICKDTIEEKIIQLQQRKTTLSENLIGDTEGFVKELTKEDVEFLFG
jgi:SNF2 family DNA or RNA helicase